MKIEIILYFPSVADHRTAAYRVHTSSGSWSNPSSTTSSETAIFVSSVDRPYGTTFYCLVRAVGSQRSTRPSPVRKLGHHLPDAAFWKVSGAQPDQRIQRNHQLSVLTTSLIRILYIQNNKPFCYVVCLIYVLSGISCWSFKSLIRLCGLARLAGGYRH